MKSILHDLHSNEAILLLYISGELPECDRVVVDRMLQNDGGLRAQLAEMKWSLNLLDTGMQQQGSEVANIDFDRVIADTNAALRRRRMQGLGNAAKRPEAAKLPLPWWCYPVAVAASLLIATAVFFANMDPGRVTLPSPKTEVVLQTPDLTGSAALNFPSLEGVEATRVADDLVATLDDTGAAWADVEDGHLAAAGREVDALRDLSRRFDGAIQ